MKKTVLALAAIATFATAGAASAQSWRHDNASWMSINQRQAQLDQRIDRGVETGQLNRREAARLRAQFRDIARLESRYRRNGLSSSERIDLDRRFDQLAMQIRSERRDGDRYGYNDRRW